MTGTGGATGSLEGVAMTVMPRGMGRAVNTPTTLPPWAVLRHVVNHATYHRGQVASKLKRFGVEQPATDFVYWVFEQIPQQG